MHGNQYLAPNDNGGLNFSLSIRSVFIWRFFFWFCLCFFWLQLPSFFLSHFTEHEILSRQIIITCSIYEVFLLLTFDNLFNIFSYNLLSFQRSGGYAIVVRCTNIFDGHNYFIRKTLIGEEYPDYSIDEVELDDVDDLSKVLFSGHASLIR